jgi:hypothetical protein
VAALRKSSESVEVDPRPEELSSVTSASAVDALVRLRAILDNDELTERIPTELREAGFTRAFFSRTWAEEISLDLGDSSVGPTPSARLTVPVFAWRKPVGQLHAASNPAAPDVDQIMLQLFGEAVGAIFERNGLTERLRTANIAARQYVREIYLLSEPIGQETNEMNRARPRS